MVKLVKVCRTCSNLNISELKQFAHDNKIKLKLGCIGQCRRNHPEYMNQFVGMIDKELIVVCSEEAFYEKMK